MKDGPNEGSPGSKNAWLRSVSLTAGVSVTFFVVLYALYIVTNGANPAGVKIDPTLVFIALIPFFIWLIVSGRIKELKGPGGLDAIFMDAANAPITTETGSLPVEATQTATKGSIEALDSIVESAPDSLSFQVGKTDYDNGAITNYLDALQSNPEFKNVIFVDAGKKFKGMMKAHDFRTLHGSSRRGSTAHKIASGDILNSPGVISNAIHLGASNKEALEQMERTGLDTLPVVDAQGKYVGYVKKDRILGNIVSRLLSRE